MPRLWSGVAKSGNRPWVRAAALSRAVRCGLRALVVSAIPAPGVWPWPDHRGWFRRLAGDLPLPKRDCQFGEHDGEVGDRRENAKLSHPLWVVCHERRMSCVRRATVREIKEGPSSSVIRSRSQATASCCGQKPWWCCVKKVRERCTRDEGGPFGAVL